MPFWGCVVLIIMERFVTLFVLGDLFIRIIYQEGRWYHVQ